MSKKPSLAALRESIDEERERRVPPRFRCAFSPWPTRMHQR